MEKQIRGFWQFACCAALGFSALLAETARQVDPSLPLNGLSARVRVYAPGAGVAAPSLLSAMLPPEAVSPCELKVDGSVYLALLVDIAGVPHNLTFIQPTGSDLDELALRIVSEDRFTPGTLGGIPVVVAESVEVTLHTCLLTVEAEGGLRTYKLRLRATPEQRFTAMPNPPKEAVLSGDAALDSAIDPKTSHARRIGGSVTAPVPVHTLAVQVPGVKRKSQSQQSCLISVVIDSHGMPIEPKVLRGLNSALDSEALEAVKNYRFRPATQDGRPVAIRLVVEVKFHFY